MDLILPSVPQKTFLRLLETELVGDHQVCFAFRGYDFCSLNYALADTNFSAFLATSTFDETSTIL